MTDTADHNFLSLQILPTSNSIPPHFFMVEAVSPLLEEEGGEGVYSNLLSSGSPLP